MAIYFSSTRNIAIKQHKATAIQDINNNARNEVNNDGINSRKTSFNTSFKSITASFILLRFIHR